MPKGQIGMNFRPVVIYWEYMHFGKIADMKWIHAAYRTIGFSVKSWPREMRFWGNKKGKSIGSDSPI